MNKDLHILANTAISVESESIPLPPPWVMKTHPNGSQYYHNDLSGIDQDEHPLARIMTTKILSQDIPVFILL